MRGDSFNRSKVSSSHFVSTSLNSSEPTGSDGIPISRNIMAIAGSSDERQNCESTLRVSHERCDTGSN